MAISLKKVGGATVERLCVMQECCRKFPSRIFPENSWWSYFYTDGERKLSSYIADIIPIGPGRRYTLSIYSPTTQPSAVPYHLVVVAVVVVIVVVVVVVVDFVLVLVLVDVAVVAVVALVVVSH